MYRKAIERALAKYVAHEDADVQVRLAAFGPALLKICDIQATLPRLELPSFDAARLEEAKKGGATLLTSGLFTIDETLFLEKVREMAQTLMTSLDVSGAIEEICKNVDWQRYTTPDLVIMASRVPLDYLNEVEKIASTNPNDETVLDYFILPVLGFTLRAFLDRFSTEMSQAIERGDDEVCTFDRSKTCPICGSDAALAAVVATPKNGQIKKLYCACCGGSWQFERIRCTHCGERATSDLQYVHDEGDEAHRLHICKACGTAMPTLFAGGDEETFSPDVEEIVMIALECAYGEETSVNNAMQA